MRDLQPGEVIYLSRVRNGKRVQVTMPVPANTCKRITDQTSDRRTTLARKRVVSEAGEIGTGDGDQERL